MKTSNLYHGDCHEILPTLPAGFVNAVFLDMPYLITDCEFELDFAEMLTGKRKRFDYTRHADRMAMHDYLLYKLLPALQRVCAPNAVIIATSSKGFSAVLNFAWGDYKVDEGVWIKSNHTNQAALKRKMPAKHELISVFAFGKGYTFNPLMGEGKPYKGFRNDLKTTGEANGKMKSVHHENLGTRYLGGLFHYPRVHKAQHSTQKPEPLWEDLMNIYTNKGDLVLDPFAGVGTTAKACLQLGREYICIEKDAHFFGLMQENVKAHSNGLIV
jgi:site-specific DNA-methyltransferase (adenine-specific)